MVVTNMPAAEVEVTPDLVRGLLRDQRPDLAELDLKLMGTGWDNVSVLIGDRLVGRFPRRLASVQLIRNEATWLPIVGPALSMPVPIPVFAGEPGAGYPWPWSIASFLPGSPAIQPSFLDHERCAAQLGRFLSELHVAAPPEAPTNPFRGVPLADRDLVFRERLESLNGYLDSVRVTSVWESALAAEPYSSAPVWLHGDLQPHNLLASDGSISAVVDFGDITSGDPATDLSIAWSLLPPGARPRFWEQYGQSDEHLAARARGWALNLGTAMLANSADNEPILAVGERTIAAALAGD